MEPLLLLLVTFPAINCFINEFHHVTHSKEDISFYKTAKHRGASFTFPLTYKNRKLDLKLYPADHESSLSTPLLDSHDDHSLFTGYVIGDPQSEVVGHFTESGAFSGVITTESDVIHVEPSHRFGFNHSHNVVYHKSDVNYTSVYQHLKSQKPESYHPETSQKIDEENIILAKRSSGFPKRKKTCPVFLVSDHLFFKEMGDSKEEQTKNELMLHLREADKIFRSTDFNNDGINDNIGFSVANMTILKENTDENKFSDSVIKVKDFLDRWSEYNHDMYCLAVLFTYRDFDSGVLGLAWVASVDGAPGGICQKRQSVGGYNRNLNTAIVSLINFGRYVGHAVSFITVAHELGHNFGSSHDEDTPECSPGMRTGRGNYIMYARATDGNLPNNVMFSRCSKRAVARVLEVKAGLCFEKETSYCGNKIKEWDEVCDCGNQDTCDAIDRCCTPKSSTTPGCTLKSPSRNPHLLSYKYQCSPQEGPCCDKRNCSFYRKSEPCQGEETCKHSSYCNGTSGSCPIAPFKDKELCNQGSNTCYQGECTGSVCQLSDLEECECQGDNLCTVCCMEDDMCRPTGSHIKHKTKLTYLVSGRSCNNFKGYCDMNHKCIQVNLENPLTTLDDIFSKQNLGNAFQWLKTHWYYTLAIIGGTSLLCILLKVTYRKSPMKKYVRQISQTLRRGGGLKSGGGNCQYHHHQLIATPSNDEDQDRLNRMCAMFPTATPTLAWDVRKEAVSEEAAVIKLLNLGYPFKPNSL